MANRQRETIGLENSNISETRTFKSILLIVLFFLLTALCSMLISPIIVVIYMFLSGVGFDQDIPTRFYVLEIISDTIFTIFSGFLIAIISKKNEYRYSLITGILFLLFYISTEIISPSEAVWYGLICNIKIIPAILFGTFICLKFRQTT